jgi:Uma2 family endonuclease
LSGLARSVESVSKGDKTMATDLKKKKRKPAGRQSGPELTWEIARLFPAQGDWSEEEYLELDTNRLVEYSDGFLDFLPMPTVFHQLILQFLYEQLKSFVVANNLGTVLIAGYKVRLRPRKYREPDILFIKAAHWGGIKKQYCEKADLVIEVVSEKNRPHDIKIKRIEYAEAGIPEYWIIDPEEELITVLVLKSRQKIYSEFGTFRKGELAASKLLRGFTVDVTTVLSQKPTRPKANGRSAGD